MENSDNKKSRRDFLKLGILAGAATLSTVGTSSLSKHSSKDKGGRKVRVLTQDGKLAEVDEKSIQPDKSAAITNVEAREGIAGKKFVMVIDLAKCDGDRACTIACQKMHYVPSDREWIKVYRMQDDESTAPYWFPKPCFHCDNPPCTKVCPVNATFKRQDGIVLIDNERCIGCRFCMAACPYSARFFNWGKPNQPPEIAGMKYSPEQSYPAKKGTVEKCDFCPDLVRLGKLPACVTSCPMDAIYYGDENEDAVTNHSGETVSFSKLIKDNAGYLYLEELGTKPRVYYLPPKNRRYPGPVIEKEQDG